ncbi:MAG: FAD binding domain-containing protein [Isosphaeraceae bacterium]
MNAFEYASPNTPELAIQALNGRPGSEALGGGTDLINRMKDYVTSPPRVVYLKDAAALRGIKTAPGGLTIGATTTLAEVLADETVAKSYPALRQATLEVGTPQIRAMGTVGGNLLQRPRCWYYRSGFGLLALKDGKSMVREGDNRYHAIFQTDGNALFVCPSSLAIPLIALGATATIQGDGKRVVPVEQLFRAPKSAQESELTVKPGELLLSVMIPPAKGKNASYEARWKQSHDWPLSLCSVNLTMDGDKVADARIVLGAVASVPLRSAEAEDAIRGKAVTTETAEAAAKAAVASAKPLSMNAYKVGLTKSVVKRALLSAVGQRYWEA